MGAPQSGRTESVGRSGTVVAEAEGDFDSNDDMPWAGYLFVGAGPA